MKFIDLSASAQQDQEMLRQGDILAYRGFESRVFTVVLGEPFRRADRTSLYVHVLNSSGNVSAIIANKELWKTTYDIISLIE